MKIIRVKVYGTKTTVDAFVDDADYEYYSRWSWGLYKNGYAGRVTCVAGGRRHTVFLHRAIAGVEHGDPRNVDHINRNKLDNQRVNLRVTSHRENNYNRIGLKTKGGKAVTSTYKGVRRRHGKPNTAKPWAARITADGHERHLGVFATEEQAALAYNAAALDLHGEFALLNQVGDAA